MNRQEFNQTYPLVNMAFNEVAGLARFLGGDVAPELTEVKKDYVQIAESLMDGTKEEKEAAVVGAILMQGMPYLFDDIRRFENDYSDEVKEFVHSILQVEGAVPQEESYVAVAAGALIAIYELNAFTSGLKCEEIQRQDIEADENGLALIEQGDADALSDMFILKNRAPRLLEEVQSAAGECRVALSKLAP